jgi:thioredoxin 1
LKKLLVIGGIIVAIFILIVVLSNKSNETKLKENPYGTEKLEQSTINLIGNENYNNIILPDELAKKVKSGDPVTAYFFSPECSYCLEMTPVLMPIAKEMDVTVYQYNLLEFNPQATSYGITSTPTLVHFKDGKEVGRMVGAQPADNIRAFFTEYETE